MKIICENAQEETLMVKLCDVALRAGGIRNRDEVNKIMASITIEPKKKGKGDDENKTQKGKTTGCGAYSTNRV